MKHTFCFSLLFLFLFAQNSIAQLVWTGPSITFTKANNADWTQEENQDRITDNIRITRANNMGIFNIAQENSYNDFSSPAGTEWAFGTTSDLNNLVFNNWEDTHEGNPPGMVNRNMVVHLIEDDVYIDIRFTSWTSGGAGGGFSYIRSTDQSSSIYDSDRFRNITVSPNPSQGFITIRGLEENTSYKIFSIDGKLCMQGTAITQEKINIEVLDKGNYIMKLDTGQTIQFARR